MTDKKKLYLGVNIFERFFFSGSGIEEDPIILLYE